MGIRSLIQIIILTFTLNLYAELGNESFDLKNYRAGGMTDGGSCGVITPEGDLKRGLTGGQIEFNLPLQNKNLGLDNIFRMFS